MKIVDANIILRFLMEDNIEQFEKSKKIIENNEIIILNEVLAEVIYVLEKFYKVERSEIKEGLFNFFNNINIKLDKKDIALCALKKYSEIKLDFVDCILYAYAVVEKKDIETFDKKLLKEIKNEVVK